MKQEFHIRRIQAGRWTPMLVLAAMLLALPAEAQNLRIVHCLYGCPEGAPAANQLLLRPIYALSYNSQHKSADWVAYRVTAETVGIASSLSRNARTDDYMEEQTLDNSDFSSAAELDMVHAHYAPLVNFAGTPYWDDVNFLSNAVARSASLSQGAWYGLNWAVRNLVNREAEVYVLTGPLYDQDQPGIRLPIDKPHRIPDGFYKLVVTPQGEAAGFRFSQDTSAGIHHCNLRASIAELEAATGLRFFPGRNRPLSETLYSSLGCF
ncbi:MAG: DNA/RNA non-specific endonuclease [Pseudomonadales bacterium]|nr:DNA/RNA non-specific endonuclease [Pseudomonadales bacterium]